MPKPMFVWSGSAWVSVASEVESLATYATQSYADNSSNVAAGLKPLVPSSVAIGSGSSSVSTLGQVSFSGVSSVSLNDVFSTTYDNYKILINISSGNTSGNLFMRMRVSGSDNTNNEYTRTKLYVNQTNTIGSDSGSSGTSSFFVSGIETNNTQSVIELQAPFLTQRTKHITIASQSLNSYLLQGSTTVTTSYTGFTLFHDITTMTGTVSVYGYKD